MPDFPRMATPAEVWAHATRTMTAITGTPRTDLMGEDASFEAGTGARKVRIDAAISTRSAHAAADIWAVAARTITALTGTPRSDLIGVDATLEASTGTRAVRIDRLAAIETFEAPVEGTASFLTTDIYPKTVTICLSEVGVKHVVECFVDLALNVAGETIRADEYISVVTPVAYRLYAQESYLGVQALPMLFISTKPARYGLKVDLYMAVAPAANRSYPWQWFRRRVA